MERYLSIEVRYDVARADLKSAFAKFAPDCPDLLPVVVTIRQDPYGPSEQDAQTWLRRRHIPCWYVEDGPLEHEFAPREALLIEELADRFEPWIVMVGPS